MAVCAQYLVLILKASVSVLVHVCYMITDLLYTDWLHVLHLCEIPKKNPERE